MLVQPQPFTVDRRHHRLSSPSVVVTADRRSESQSLFVTDVHHHESPSLFISVILRCSPSPSPLSFIVTGVCLWRRSTSRLFVSTVALRLHHRRSSLTTLSITVVLLHHRSFRQATGLSLLQVILKKILSIIMVSV